MSPCVLLLYPVWILPVTLGLGVYGGISQVSWYCHTWRKELTDPEKGTETPFILHLPRLCGLQLNLNIFQRNLNIFQLNLNNFQGSSGGCVTSSPSPTVPRTKWSSSPRWGMRTPAPSPASSDHHDDGQDDGETAD